MGVRSIQGSTELGQQIKKRRNELGLTIEGAASKAGVGTKTWCRYEAGESIRQDKSKGICKALNWAFFPSQEAEKVKEDKFDIREYKEHEAWSTYLETMFGELAAISFAIGSDILLDHLNEDIDALAVMPRGTHLGQLPVSFIVADLPEQFLTYYDYDFVFAFRCTVKKLRERAQKGHEMMAHSVMEELAYYLIVEEAEFLMGSLELEKKYEDYEYWKDWIFDIFDKADIEYKLYSELSLLDEKDEYHFKNWMN